MIPLGQEREPLRLREYTTSERVALSPAECDGLRAALPNLDITPSVGSEGCYDLRSGHQVGVLRVADLQVEIRPRLAIEHVLFLVSYAIDPARWRDHQVTVSPDDDLVEALIPTFAHLVGGVLRRGLLHNYRHLEETTPVVRGRLRHADQLRRRPGLAYPVEVAYDDFTVDILENRLLLVAIERLLRSPLRHASSRSSLQSLRGQFVGVGPEQFRPGDVPEPQWNRLNERYRPAVSLARLVLAGTGIDVASGDGRTVVGTGLLLDMARVFEDFVVVALREALGLGPRALRQGDGLWLDEEQTVWLKPDLTWWEGGRCLFAGDCKYKRTKVDGVPNADLYQLLAYATALGLPDGQLVYAAADGEATGAHTVRHAGTVLHQLALDLDGPPSQVLAEIAALASRIRQMAYRPALLMAQ